MTDLFLLLQLPNAGDDLQAIKRGVMEHADIVVVNKADLDPEAARRAALQLGAGLRDRSVASVVSALTGEGIAALWKDIEARADSRRREQATRDSAGNGAQTDTERVQAGSPRPFRILGLQQIAIGGEDRQRLRRLWVDLLGLPVIGQFISERENVAEYICALGAGPHRVEVDLMQPIDMQGKPAVHQPPLNHIGLWVDDLPRAMAWLEAQGLRFAPGGIRRGAAGYDVCFIHPRAGGEFPLGGEGVLIELVQAPAEVISGLASANRHQ
jgi:lactoylglutathione lyase